jgi:cytochrome o ubiquinol oxidase subunit 1
MAGYNYWFPKAFGFMLDERWGRASFWCWLIGFYVAFMPLYLLGLMGMTRRMQHYDAASWQLWLVVAAAGAGIILLGMDEIEIPVDQLLNFDRRHQSEVAL